MDKVIEYTSRSGLRRSTAIARRLSDLASVTTSSRTASGGTFTWPSRPTLPIVTIGGQIVTHSLTAHFFTATTRNWALKLLLQNSITEKYINLVSRHLFLTLVGRANTGISLGKQTVPPRDLNGTVRAASAKSQVHRGKASLSGLVRGWQRYFPLVGPLDNARHFDTASNLSPAFAGLRVVFCRLPECKHTIRFLSVIVDQKGL